MTMVLKKQNKTSSDCGHIEQYTYPFLVAQEIGYDANFLEKNAKAMAQTALVVQKEKCAHFSFLPFSSVYEVMPLLSLKKNEIAFDHNHIKDYPYFSPHDVLAAWKPYQFTSEPFLTVFEACRLLKAQGNKIAVQISGAVSLLCRLIEFTSFIRSWKKDPQHSLDCLFAVHHEQSRYIAALVDNGVDLISFADPVLERRLLGPLFFDEVAKKSILPFLSHTKSLLGESTLYLCPRLAKSLFLVKENLFYTKSISIQKKEEFFEVLKEFKQDVCSSSCIHTFMSSPFSGQMLVLQ